MLKGFKVDNSSAEQGQEQTDRFMALVVPERIPDSLLAEAEDGCVGAVLTSVGRAQGWSFAGRLSQPRSTCTRQEIFC